MKTKDAIEPGRAYMMRRPNSGSVDEALFVPLEGWRARRQRWVGSTRSARVLIVWGNRPWHAPAHETELLDTDIMWLFAEEVA